MNLFLLTLLSLSQLLNAQENDLLEILNQMRASDSLTEDQRRDLSFDIKSTYDTILRIL